MSYAGDIAKKYGVIYEMILEHDQAVSLPPESVVSKVPERTSFCMMFVV